MAVLEHAEREDWEACLASIAGGMDVSVANSWGATALHFAAMKGNEDVCRALINAKADPSARDRYTDQPAGWASQNGHKVPRH